MYIFHIIVRVEYQIKFFVDYYYLQCYKKHSQSEGKKKSIDFTFQLLYISKSRISGSFNVWMQNALGPAVHRTATPQDVIRKKGNKTLFKHWYVCFDSIIRRVERRTAFQYLCSEGIDTFCVIINKKSVQVDQVTKLRRWFKSH